MEYWRVENQNEKSKELGKKNEGKEFKKEMTEDKAAKILTKEINKKKQN